MADTYCAIEELPPIATVEQLAPQPALLDESIISPVAVQPYLGGYPGNGPYAVTSAAFALFNGKGSGKKVNVIGLSIEEMQARTGTGGAFSFGLQRITELSGGDASEFTPLDSAASEVPPTVVAVEQPAAITTTGATFRNIPGFPQLSPTLAVPYPTWRLPGSADRIYGCPTSELQGIVLREGEGVAIMTSASNTMGENWPLAIVVLLGIGGSTYLVRTRVTLGAWAAQLALFNGVGSGAVVTIYNVSIAEMLTADTASLRRFQLGTISGITANSTLERIEVDKHDSTSPDLPTQIVVATKAGCLQASTDAQLGGRGDENVLRRLVQAPMGAGPGLATTAWLKGKTCVLMQRSDAPIVLREGEGIALFQRTNVTNWGWGFYLRCMFTVEDAAGLSPAAPVLGGSIVRAA